MNRTATGIPAQAGIQSHERAVRGSGLQLAQERPGLAGQSGFTLVEMVVALGLLALISIAGLGLVNTVLGAQRRTDARLERLATLERAIFLIDADFAQAVDGPHLLGDAVVVRRTTREGQATAGYAFVGGALVRLYNMTPQPLIPNVAAARWRFHRAGVWEATPPPKPDDPVQDDAIELTLTLAPGDGAPGGTVRRVIPLTARPT